LVVAKLALRIFTVGRPSEKSSLHYNKRHQTSSPSPGAKLGLTPVITSWSQGAWVALDILLVALLIYQVLVMIRGTRAVPMLVGLTVVAITFYFARVGELTTLNWVVSRVLPYVVFALIVVFQSEIRHVLADLGRRLTFFGGSSGENDSYDDIVLAANLFSQHQTGALIVIEREIGLRTHIESGVPLDARLSYDLLATIFRPSAPLHDGAVIVQKDRIAAAACFLPLSMNPLLSTQLGTRHRAGIGITEETDAIAVICSEETGAISFALGGRIERDLTVEQLRERLGTELRRHMTPVTLPTAIAHIDDESDAALDSPLVEPAPQRKSDSAQESQS
jgi:diadenylate cyclase